MVVSVAFVSVVVARFWVCERLAISHALGTVVCVLLYSTTTRILYRSQLAPYAYLTRPEIM
jgi:hypothetical protein